MKRTMTEQTTMQPITNQKSTAPRNTARKNTVKHIAVVAIGILLASSPLAVGAEPRQRMMRLESLDLSATQRDQIRDIRQARRETMPESREALRQERENLRELMASDRDRAELLSQFEELQSLRRDHERAMFETMLDIREILTPAQRQQLADMTAEQRENWRSERGM